MAETYVHPSAYVDDGAQIGTGCRIWHFCHIMSTAFVGEGCSLGQNVFVADHVALGPGCKVQNNVSIFEGVQCEAEVFLGPSMVFTNVLHPRAHVNRRGQFRSTLLEKRATVGANATLLCGIRVGAYAMIGAGAVVTQDVKPYALMTGIPARQAGWVSQAGERLQFNRQGIAQCPLDGSQYRLDQNGKLDPLSP